MTPFKTQGSCQSYNDISSFTGCPEQKVKRLIDQRTKGFCTIVKFYFDFNRKHSNLDFETKLVQMWYELIEIHQCQNWQVDFNLQNFAGFWGIDFDNAYTLNNMPLWRNICRIQVKMITYGLFSN